jgi:hypothetical protein
MKKANLVLFGVIVILGSQNALGMLRHRDPNAPSGSSVLGKKPVVCVTLLSGTDSGTDDAASGCPDGKKAYSVTELPSGELILAPVIRGFVPEQDLSKLPVLLGDADLGRVPSGGSQVDSDLSDLD